MHKLGVFLLGLAFGLGFVSISMAAPRMPVASDSDSKSSASTNSRGDSKSSENEAKAPSLPPLPSLNDAKSFYESPYSKSVFALPMKK